MAESKIPKDLPHYIRVIAKQILALNKQIAKSKVEHDKRAAEADKRAAEADKRAADTDKRLADFVADFGKQLAESKAEAAKERRDLRRQMGETDNRFGKLAEAMTLGNVMPLLNSHKDITVHVLRYNDSGSYEGENYEIDALAFGDHCVVVIEAKASLRRGHIGKFVGRGSLKLRKFFDIHPEHRGKKLYGAVAYLKADEQSKELANQKGLLIIESTHANKTLVNPQVKLCDYTPKE